MGGLARRATLLNQVSQEGAPVLLVDTGDTLYATTEPRSPEQERAKAGTILKAMGHMGYAALAVGDQELGAGVEVLTEQAREAGVPLLSANLVDADGKALFEAARVVEVDGLKVGLVGVSSADPSPEAARAYARAKVTATPVVPAARKAVDSLKGRHDVLVVLGHVTPKEGRELAEALPEARLVLLGGSGRILSVGERAGDALVYEGGRRGQLVLRLDVTLRGEGALADAGLRRRMERELEAQQRRKVALEARLAEAEAGRKDAMQRALAGAEEQVKRSQERLDSESGPGGTVSARAVSLDKRFEKDPAVAAIVEGGEAH